MCSGHSLVALCSGPKKISSCYGGLEGLVLSFLFKTLHVTLIWCHFLCYFYKKSYEKGFGATLAILTTPKILKKTS